MPALRPESPRLRTLRIPPISMPQPQVTPRTRQSKRRSRPALRPLPSEPQSAISISTRPSPAWRFASAAVIARSVRTRKMRSISWSARLQGQRGYLIDVQGYSPLRGQAGITASHDMASAVTRYLVTDRQVPLYKIRQIGLGNAPLTVSDSNKTRRGSIVEVTLMHNSLSTLSASNVGASTTGAAQSGNAQSSSNGTASQPSSTSNTRLTQKLSHKREPRQIGPSHEGPFFCCFHPWFESACDSCPTISAANQVGIQIFDE